MEVAESIESGFKITVGNDDILPAESRKFVNETNKLLDRYNEHMVITNNKEYEKSQRDRVDIRNIGDQIIVHEKLLVTPVRDLLNDLKDELRPLKQKYNVTIFNKDTTIKAWASAYKKKLNEDRVEKLKNAEEMKLAIQQQNEIEINNAKLKTDAILAKRTDGIDEKRKLETKKTEKEIEVLQISRQLEEKKDEVTRIVEPSQIEEYERNIHILDMQKNAIEDELRNIDITIENKVGELRDIREEEISARVKLRGLEVDNQSIVVVLPEPFLEDIPKISSLNIATYIDYEVEDLNMVPKEFTETIITLNDEKVKKVIKLYGLNTNIPGIKVFEKQVVRSKKDGHNNKNNGHKKKNNN